MFVNKIQTLVEKKIRHSQKKKINHTQIKFRQFLLIDKQNCRYFGTKDGHKYTWVNKILTQQYIKNKHKDKILDIIKKLILVKKNYTREKKTLSTVGYNLDTSE